MLLPLATAAAAELVLLGGAELDGDGRSAGARLSAAGVVGEMLAVELSGAVHAVIDPEWYRLPVPCGQIEPCFADASRPVAYLTATLGFHPVSFGVGRVRGALGVAVGAGTVRLVDDNPVEGTASPAWEPTTVLRAEVGARAGWLASRLRAEAVTWVRRGRHPELESAWILGLDVGMRRAVNGTTPRAHKP